MIKHIIIIKTIALHNLIWYQPCLYRWEVRANLSEMSVKQENRKQETSLAWNSLQKGKGMKQGNSPKEFCPNVPKFAFIIYYKVFFKENW